jgi:hypothetical protein
MNNKFVLFMESSDSVVFARVDRCGLEKTPKRKNATEFDSASAAYEVGALMLTISEQSKWQVGQR